MKNWNWGLIGMLIFNLIVWGLLGIVIFKAINL